MKMKEYDFCLQIQCSEIYKFDTTKSVLLSTGRCTSFASPMLGACTKTSTCRVAKLNKNDQPGSWNTADPTDSFEASGRKVEFCLLGVRNFWDSEIRAAAFWLSFCFFFPKWSMWICEMWECLNNLWYGSMFVVRNKNSTSCGTW